MRNIVVLGGSSHPDLVSAICDRLGIKPANVKLSKFSNNETNVEIFESVRGMDVFVLQSACGKVNDNLMETLILVNACKIASARKVTVVLPLFPYSRQPEGPYKRNGMPLNRLSPEACNKLAEMQGVPFPHAHLVAGNTNSSSLPPSRSPSPSKELASPANAPPLPASAAMLRTASPERDTTAALTLQSPGGSYLRSSSISSRGCTTDLPAYPSAAGPRGQQPGAAGYKVWTAKPGTLIADMLVSAGAQHIITLDMHHPQYQGFFDIPVDNLVSFPLMHKYIIEKIPEWPNAVIVSPDAGGAKRATQIADALNLPFALIHKDRRAGLSSSLTLVGNVRDKVVILIDDIADTCHTITRAAHVLTANGASKVYALITHGIFSGEAIHRLARSPIDQLIVSNSVPQQEHVRLAAEVTGNKDKITVFDVAPLFAESIRRIHNGESVSFLFEAGVPIVH
ncbi:phosphoribosyltransferase-like protein [Catenaria anguillulae PL171]|uniref:ribose-phosphate diphosphokinase n=1 Tax=Catenaria anguillulae PL171 TaxID=765915 RepID=A0A1Y2I2K7_9FUNG|nr:phosphoribosyltransferase-like protein [Catenaria anguillulae PL171]